MRKGILAAALITLAASSAASAGATEPPATTRFDIRAERGPSGYTALVVTLRFQGEHDGDSTLHLPDEWAGHRQFYRSIRDLGVEGATLLPADQAPQARRLTHAPDAAITVRYRVVVDGDGPTVDANQANDYRVRIEPDFVFALGESYLAKPDHIAQDSAVLVTLGGFAPAHRFASDLEHAASGRALSYGDAVQSVLIGGDIRLIDAGDGARLAIRGSTTTRDDAGWQDAFRAIAQAEHQYWRTGAEPFLVTILSAPPPEPGRISVSGTGRTDAFAFFATDNAPAAMLDKMMAHEMMHTWIPFRIGGFSSDGDPILHNWLVEGFTDWAAFRVMARSGLWTAEDFAKAFNEKLQAYDLSPVREAPNARVQAEFWSSPGMQQLPYQRGLLMATYWDAEIRRITHGRRDFDDVLWRMRERAPAHPALAPGELLSEALRHVAGIDFRSDFDIYIERGKAVEFAPTLFAPCGEVSWRERKTFERGFDVDKTLADDKRFAGVVEGGPAWRAGLRDGMVLVKRSAGEIGDSRVEIAYDVIDAGTPKTLRWLPEGEGVERFREFTVEPAMDAQTRASCQAVIGG